MFRNTTVPGNVGLGIPGDRRTRYPEQEVEKEEDVEGLFPDRVGALVPDSFEAGVLDSYEDEMLQGN